MKLASVLVFEFVFVLGSVGCVPAASNPRPEYGQGGAAAPQAGLGCLEIYQCFSSCQDGACTSNCLARGAPDARAAANASLACTSACADQGEDCVATRCASEIEACRVAGPSPVAQSTPQPAGDQLPTTPDRPRQPVSNSAILPWLTGEWIGNNHQYVFYGDGRVRRSSGVALYTDKGVYGCVSLVNDIGTVTQEGDYLVMNFEASETDHCRERSSGPALTVRYLIDWKDDYSNPDGPLQLILREQNCTRGGTMYCDDPMRRR